MIIILLAIFADVVFAGNALVSGSSDGFAVAAFLTFDALVDGHHSLLID